MSNFDSEYNQMTHKRQMKGFIKRHPIISSLVAMVLLSGLILYIITLSTRAYTRHGQETIVPQLKGLSIDEGLLRMQEEGLLIEVVDSVYTDGVAPGSIVETVPEAGRKVKPGRIVFLTVNALSPKQGAVPNILDISSREAIAILTSIGFTNVTERQVTGDFPGLTAGVEDASGRLISPGTRLALTTPLVVRVIIGGNPFVADTIDFNFPADTDSTFILEPDSDQDTGESWW